jgi:hypothetical protein
MATVIRCCGWANGTECPHEGQFIKTFDHEAFDGRGYGEFTPNVSEARQFATNGEAMEFWRKVSTVRPKRPDGKPNCPLTSMHVEICTLPAANFELCPMTPAALLRIVRRLPASTAIADRVPARTPHKQHWIGWLAEYNSGGAYGRKHHDRTAEYAYNHLNSPGMLIWINEAAGIWVRPAFNFWQKHQDKSKPTQAAIIRDWLSWNELELKLNPRRDR